MKVWRVDFGSDTEDRNGPYFRDPLRAIAFVAEALSKGHTQVQIERSEMTEKQFSKLGEYGGI